MAGVYGADIVELKRLAQSFNGAAGRLDEVRAAVEQSIAMTVWAGLDAEEFRAAWWSRRSGSVARCAADLVDAGGVLLANAGAQEAASSASAGMRSRGVRGLPAGGRGDRGVDMPGNPGRGDHGEWVSVPPDIPFDDAALAPGALNQQGLGDCWLLAGLGAVVHDDPDWIREHMRRNDDGTWTVTMYKDAQPVEITVDPAVVSGGVMDSDGNPSWASVYEKAAAEYWGGNYDDLDGGYSSDAFEAITGATASKVGESSLADLGVLLAAGPVVLGSENDSTWWPWDDEVNNSHIVPNHAYVVDAVEEYGDQAMVHVINPWGPGDHRQGDGSVKFGDAWLTEEQYRNNFDTVYSIPTTRDER